MDDKYVIEISMQLLVREMPIFGHVDAYKLNRIATGVITDLFYEKYGKLPASFDCENYSVDQVGGNIVLTFDKEGVTFVDVAEEDENWHKERIETTVFNRDRR